MDIKQLDNMIDRGFEKARQHMKNNDFEKTSILKEVIERLMKKRDVLFCKKMGWIK